VITEQKLPWIKYSIITVS